MHFLLFVSFIGSLITGLLWLFLVACWNFNPRLIPKIQLSFLSFLFQLFWYSRLMIPHFEPKTACILCHKLASSTSESNCHDQQSFDMNIVAQLISLPTRPHRSFYFFAGFVYPLLPLDLTGNQSESWNRISSCFIHILNHDRIVFRSEHITEKYALEMAHELSLKQQQKISDVKLRYMICQIMWELVFALEPTKFDLQTITQLTESVSQCFTHNTDADWSNRIDLCVIFMQQIRNHRKFVKLQVDFQLTAQELCTVIAMEFFITPALEIVEVMSNLMMELRLDHKDLIAKVSDDSDLMRHAIIVTAHHYPVLQNLFREISYLKDDQYLTPCSNLFSDTHSVEIQTDEITKMIKHKSFIDDLSHPGINLCMAFGRGQRACKGKELAMKIITTILRTFYSQLNDWCDVEISAGRKYVAFQSKTHRMYFFNRRCWIGNIQYSIDRIFRRYSLKRFQCEL